MNAPPPTRRDHHPELELLAGRSRPPIVIDIEERRDARDVDRETDRALSQR